MPLTQIDGPPEAVLRQAREQIDSQAPIEERGNLLAVAQVLTRLRYNELGLLQIFGGSQAMIESPLIQEVLAERMHRAIASVLLRRFGTVPHDVLAQLKLILDDVKLDELTFWAGECPDLDSFRTRLS